MNASILDTLKLHANVRMARPGEAFTGYACGFRGYRRTPGKGGTVTAICHCGAEVSAASLADAKAALAGHASLSRSAAAWTIWSGVRPTVVLTDAADLHTCAHELAHILLGHGSHYPNPTDAKRAQLEIDAETGAIAILSAAGVIDKDDRARSTTYIVAWLAVNPKARPSRMAQELRIA